MLDDLTEFKNVDVWLKLVAKQRKHMAAVFTASGPPTFAWSVYQKLLFFSNLKFCVSLFINSLFLSGCCDFILFYFILHFLHLYFVVLAPCAVKAALTPTNFYSKQQSQCFTNTWKIVKHLCGFMFWYWTMQSALLGMQCRFSRYDIHFYFF